MTAFLAALLPHLVPVLGSILTAGLSWLAVKVGSAASASAAKSRAEAAALKLAALAVTLAQRGWDRLSPTIKAALADGRVDAEERARIEAEVRALVGDVVTREELDGIAKAMGLPLSGLFALIASKLIETWTKAHDPATTEVSAKTFPVGRPPATWGGNVGEPGGELMPAEG